MSEANGNGRGDRLRLERNVTLGLAFAVFVQAGGALVWAGSTAQRIEQLERQAISNAIAFERLARLETQAVALRAQLDRIEQRLDPR